MGWFFKRKQDIREEPVTITPPVSDPLLKAIVGNGTVTRDNIMSIPTVAGCINKIADTVSMMQVKMYRRNGDRIDEVVNDRRLYLLNHETGDTLDATQFKRAMVVDMYLGKGGYAYVNKSMGQVSSIHYVESEKVSSWSNTDPIFKDYRLQVNGKMYETWQFIKLLRDTKNGVYSRPIVEESELLLSVLYNTMKFEEKLVKTGGNKKGFLQSANHLTEAAMSSLKAAFKRLYQNNSENVIVLNDGMSFKESSNTSVEMQLKENKDSNGRDICKVFLVPPSILYGNATEEDRKTFHEECILPILERFNAAINAVMLSEEEKDEYFFAFDTNDILKGDIVKRYSAYQIALSNGFMQLDEVRRMEKLPAYNLKFIKLGLQDVLLNPETNEIYTPNTNQMTVMGQEGVLSDNNMKGGENDDESGNQG